MRRFVRKVEQSDTGMVTAEVFDLETGKRVGIEFFNFPPFFQEWRLLRAHVWATKWIKNCQMYHYDERI